MPHGPGEKYADKRGLQLHAAEKVDVGLRSVHIDLDLFEVERLIARHVFNLVCQILHSCFH